MKSDIKNSWDSSVGQIKKPIHFNLQVAVHWKRLDISPADQATEWGSLASITGWATLQM